MQRELELVNCQRSEWFHHHVTSVSVVGTVGRPEGHPGVGWGGGGGGVELSGIFLVTAWSQPPTRWLVITFLRS